MINIFDSDNQSIVLFYFIVDLLIRDIVIKYLNA